MNTLKLWIMHNQNVDNGKVDPKIKQAPQLLLTVAGEGGSGKSNLIKTIIGAIRMMFQSNSCVKVAAPTGSASFNGGGVTMHRLFNLPVRAETDTIPSKKKGKLRERSEI